jgi:hypothetical protein
MDGRAFARLGKFSTSVERFVSREKGGSPKPRFWATVVEKYRDVFFDMRKRTYFSTWKKGKRKGKTLLNLEITPIFFPIL